MGRIVTLLTDDEHLVLQSLAKTTFRVKVEVVFGGEMVLGKVLWRGALASLAAAATVGCSQSSAPKPIDPWADAEVGMSRTEVVRQANEAIAKGQTGVALRLIAKNTDAASRNEPEIAHLVERVRAVVAADEGEDAAQAMIAANFAPDAYSASPKPPGTATDKARALAEIDQLLATGTVDAPSKALLKLRDAFGPNFVSDRQAKVRWDRIKALDNRLQSQAEHSAHNRVWETKP